MINLSEKFFSIFLLIIPISILIGPSISLLNIIFLGGFYLYFFIKLKHYDFLFKDKTIRIFSILYLYLIFNTFISLTVENSISRNLGFIRFILLFLAINYLFFISEKNKKIFFFWTTIFLVFIFDVYFERITGANIFGWGALSLDGVPQPHGNRIVSFFKDEPIAGAFINGFIFLISGYLLDILKYKKYRNIIFFIAILIFLSSVLITGERSNTIKAIFGLTLFICLIEIFDFKLKITFLIILPIVIILTVFNTDYLKNRFFDQIFSQIYSEKNLKKFNDNIYIKLYKSGFEVFKNNPLIGVGNKNYRVETCDEKKAKKNEYFCMTHPHQIYFEFLSEHGLIGTILILYSFFILIFKNLRVIIVSQNYLQIGAFTFLICNFLPLIPSGAFFSDFNISLFILNLSILYAVNKKTNVFFLEKK
tara:strand:- start:63 stop:1325 length:1263 start_codon:yes stop_codon:yes gene_type:complete